MSPFKVVRAWKDEEFRHSLSSAEKASLPENPAGLIEWADEWLDDVSGGTSQGSLCSTSCCGSTTGSECQTATQSLGCVSGI